MLAESDLPYTSATDLTYRSVFPRETLEAPISRAHLILDATRVKIMGQPFDFDTMEPSGALPEAFDPDDYLTFASVANTLMTLFGVPDEKLWVTKRNGPPARRLGPGVISKS